MSFPTFQVASQSKVHVHHHWNKKSQLSFITRLKNISLVKEAVNMANRMCQCLNVSSREVIDAKDKSKWRHPCAILSKLFLMV